MAKYSKIKSIQLKKGIIMEEIIIKDNNTNTLLYLDKNSYYGFVFQEDNTIRNVDRSVCKYFDLLRLSKENTKIGIQNEYEIFLDNKTGLKHYLHNGIDNVEMLLLNNGIPAILYKDYHDNLQSHKLDQIILEIKGIIIGGTLLGLLLSYYVRNLELIQPPESISRIIYSEYSDFNIKDAHDLIYSSHNLTEEEKNILYNEDLLNDIFNTIDGHNFEKFSLKRSLKDIGIKSYTNQTRPLRFGDNMIIGYYSANPESTNTIYVLNYDGINKNNIDILTHEFIHLCQEHNCSYTAIQEACAEIISDEYNNQDDMHKSYHNQVKSVKILMEIIGPEPIWYYTFTGDFSQIEEKVKPYLTNKEYDEFLNDLVMNHKNNDINEKRAQSLNNILSTLYKNIYGEDINNNEIISLINNEKPLVRYYFNSRFINEENSYYLTNEKKEISLDEAIKLGVVKANATRERELSHEEVLKYIQNNEIIINRQIDYTNTSINIEKETIKDNKLYITGTINGKYYEDTDIDELYQLGYINVTYTIKEKKILTYEEYISDEAKQYEIDYSTNSNTIKYKDYVTTFVSKKVYIPPINNRETKEKTKK